MSFRYYALSKQFSQFFDFLRFSKAMYIDLLFERFTKLTYNIEWSESLTQYSNIFVTLNLRTKLLWRLKFWVPCAMYFNFSLLVNQKSVDYCKIRLLIDRIKRDVVTAQNMKFSIKNFFSKCDHTYWINSYWKT